MSRSNVPRSGTASASASASATARAACLRPDEELGIPAARAQSLTIAADAETADPVLVTAENPRTLSLERVPDVAVEVIVTCKQQSSRDGKCD